jgi:putative endonuclease
MGIVKTAMNRAAERAQRGARAEELCAELLRKAGLRVLARNWRCRHGEIDLVAEDGGTLVYAEVRYRSDERFGGAAESVTAAKQARLIAAARLYLMRRPDADCRFDVLLLDSLEAGRIRWIRNAFTA